MIMGKKIDTSLLDKAMKFAIEAHKGQERRGKGFPFIVHPMECVEIAATITADQEILAAAVLHDVVEDTDYTIEDIRLNFGERIASLVGSETEEVVTGKTEEESWHERKQAAIDRIKRASHDAKIVALSDKLSNARAIQRDYNAIGPTFWNIFHCNDPKEHEWHYRGLVDSLSELSDTVPFKEFARIVDEIFRK